MLFDAHTHIQFPIYDSTRKDVLRRASDAHVKMLAVGTQYSTSKAAIELSLEYSHDVWASLGFHPSHLDKEWHHDRNEQKENEKELFDARAFSALASHKRVIAIGECGLDYFRIKNNEARSKTKDRQGEVFLAQAYIAEITKKALMIHCRPSKGSDDAYEDLLSLLDFRVQNAPRILHFYVGSLAITKKLIEAGFYFTCGGVITFSHDYDEIFKYIPLDRILFETDAPYVAPEPYRGKQNEPAYIRYTVEALCCIRQEPVNKIQDTTYANSLRVFNISL